MATGMAMSMGPPLLPGYSLRVQLFSPNAHTFKDSPIRCFRVVTSPDVTVREFCQEASRIHEINYGEPLAVKKVQDDQGFDITQSEILGTLFATTSIIRVVQASTVPSARDSVPPSSALRFDPTTNRKRAAEESIRPEGNASSWKPNKRQRVSNPDPDEPLPSREDESEVAGPSLTNRRILGEKIIPNSQGSMAVGSKKVLNNTRQVRQDLPMIPETPSPSPPPEVLKPQSKKQPVTDTHTPKPNDNPENEDSSFLSNVDNSSPLREASVRAQSHVSNARAKSASYHIQRATERGTSVSTAATSPLSLDQRNNSENGVPSSSKRPRPSPRPVLPRNNGTQFRSQNEDSIYENIVSDDEASAMLRKKRETSKNKNSPRPAQERTQNTVNTPPNASRKSSAAREPITTPGKLPLTPNSAERQRQQQKKQADEARIARIAAAEAAEQRKKAAEGRQAEELRVAEEQRLQREEQERLDVEASKQAEAERNQKIIEQAARAEAERKKRDEEEAEEARRNEEARLAREEAEEKQRRQEARLARAAREKEAEQERLAKEEQAQRLAKKQAAEEARIASERKAEEERLAKETAAKAQRLRDEEERIECEKREAEAASAEAKKLELEKVSRRSTASEGSRHSKSTSPVSPKITPIRPPRPQASSTSFIPGGRKSNLKHSLSSQAMRSSSPAGPASDAGSNGTGADNQLHKMTRKVSFNENTITPRKQPTPILPPKRIIPGKTAQALKPATPAPTTQKDITPKPTATGAILPPKRQSITPIPVPKAVNRASQERSVTPVAQTKISPPPRSTPGTGSKASNGTQPLKKYGRAAARQKKANPFPVEKGPNQLEASDSYSDAESEESVSSNAGTTIPSKIFSSNTTIKYESQELRDEQDEDEDEDDEDDEDDIIDEDETQSHNTSPRDSRSPIQFNPNPGANETAKTERAGSPESESGADESDEEASDDSSEDVDDEDVLAAKSPAKANNVPSKPDNKSSSESEDDSEKEDYEEDTDPKVQVLRSSPPELPLHRQVLTPNSDNRAIRGDQNNSKGSLSHMTRNTQDELDQQLTSSMFEARSAPNSSVPTHIPASSAAMKHRFGIGASLSGLTAAKSTLVSSQAKVNGASSQKLQLAQEEEEDESEEESEDEDDSSDDEEPVLPKGKRNPPAEAAKASIKVKDTQKESNDSDSSAESEDSVDDEERTRQELLGQIDALNNKDGDSQGSLPSPTAYRSSQIMGKLNKKAEKKSDQWLVGYKFSAPA